MRYVHRLAIRGETRQDLEQYVVRAKEIDVEKGAKRGLL